MDKTRMSLDELVKRERKMKKRVIPSHKFNVRPPRDYKGEATLSKRLYLYRIYENKQQFYVVSALRMDETDFPRSVVSVRRVDDYQLGSAVSLTALGTVNAMISKDGDYFVRAGYAYNVYRDGHLPYYQDRLTNVADFYAGRLVKRYELDEKQNAINESMKKILMGAATGQLSPVLIEVMAILLPHIKQM
ncbi:hypothetical protein BNJ_00452 [Kaumoebavirus]|uniref:hypothetical protein n=1 Tax=Kaumoebavirus TaxID=1859492 RepID=UPI0009C263B6|nr:hypothetical protein BNJ_00452 [Kaumoebavirus]ARA72264.1 hypothetical protein BNJ_00452 [Kaumoebavirus]